MGLPSPGQAHRLHSCVRSTRVDLRPNHNRKPQPVVIDIPSLVLIESCSQVVRGIVSVLLYNRLAGLRRPSDAGPL